jgi:hypothetical protein
VGGPIPAAAEVTTIAATASAAAPTAHRSGLTGVATELDSSRPGGAGIDDESFIDW